MNEFKHGIGDTVHTDEFGDVLIMDLLSSATSDTRAYLVQPVDAQGTEEKYLILAVDIE